MKITNITLTPLKTGKNLLRVQTDAGVEGWAEAPEAKAIRPSPILDLNRLECSTHASTT